MYGKIQEIERNATDSNPTVNIKYTYDGVGNRISKQVTNNSGNITYTWYARDAQGNVMSTYKSAGTGGTLSSYSVDLSEQHLYGSSRVGILNRSVNMKAAYTQGDIVSFYRGYKHYELSNHLGNVLVTITDKKTGVSTNGTTIDNYTADVSSANDYYPFGMDMVDRKYSVDKYRYGFNGKENDKEFGEGMQDYGMRINDKRLGRFLSVDPLTKQFPLLTPYQFAANIPIWAKDLDGGEPFFIHGTWSNTDEAWDMAFRVTVSKIINSYYGQNNSTHLIWDWGGDNSREKRELAANYLVQWYTSPETMDQMKKAGYENRAVLIAHSHGGNIAKLVKEKLTALGWTVDLITIETPQRKEYETVSGSGKNINFYSNSDLIQNLGTMGIYNSKNGADINVKSMKSPAGARKDVNADENIKLSPYDLSNYYEDANYITKFGKVALDWAGDSGGHSLQNNSNAKKEIINKLSKIYFKENQERQKTENNQTTSNEQQ